jgi:hypothetical protein
MLIRLSLAEEFLINRQAIDIIIEKDGGFPDGLPGDG